ncbi:Neuropeptide F, partial [Frankliniella occidentalis]
GGSVLLASLVAVLLAVGPVGPVGCMAAVGGSRGGQGAPEGGLARPLRPTQFHTPEELRHYLDAVSNYYAVNSRPGRFGKRSSHVPHRGPLVGPLMGPLVGQLQREERVSAQRRDAALENNDQALEALERGLDSGDAMPDYLYQEVYPLFLDQERLSQPRQTQMQE